MSEFVQKTMRSINGDEYYSPQNVVDMIVPYIVGGGYKAIWCPFDKADSNFVTTFQNLGLNVNYGHIETGQDFFDYKEPQGDIVVSNPPFSRRNEIFERLYDMDVPFALVMNVRGLLDGRKRGRMFREHELQLLIPYGRMKFIYKDMGLMLSPNAQSVYVCNKLLDKQIVFTDDVF